MATAKKSAAKKAGAKKAAAKSASKGGAKPAAKSAGRTASAAKAPAKKAAAKGGAAKGGATKGASTGAAKGGATKTAAKGGAKSASNAGGTRAPNPAFMKPMQPSAALAAVVGGEAQPRSQITSRVWDYIKKNGLQDQQNKRQINADDKLRPVFGGKASVSMFEMTKLVNGHLS